MNSEYFNWVFLLKSLQQEDTVNLHEYHLFEYLAPLQRLKYM